MTLIDGLAIKIAHSLEDVKAVLTNRSKEQEMPITSLPELSKKIWGIQRKRLYVVGARTGIGKSAFAIQCAFDVAKGGKKVLFLSLESTVSEIVERLFCNKYNIDNFELTRGKFANFQQEWELFCKDIDGINFIVSDSIGRTMKEIYDLVDNMAEKPDLLVIDYVQMIKNIGSQRNEEIAEFVKSLRNMAIRHNMAIWLISQVNREGEGEMPTLSQLKGSGVLEEHPDVVFLLHSEKESTGEIKKYYFFVAKNRNGRIGTVDMEYHGKYYQFRDNTETPVKPPTEQHHRIATFFDGSCVKDE